MGHSLPGFAGKLPQRAQGPAPSWGACLLAGCTGEEAWRESSADTVTGGKPRCTLGEGPEEDVKRGEKGLELGRGSSHRTGRMLEAGGD